MSESNVTHGHARRGKQTPTFRTWMSMWSRVKDRRGGMTQKTYYDRGVTVCDRWKLFDNFLADMGERPDGMTIDRYPNQSGNYEPGNCRWATMPEQIRNRRYTIFVTHNGETLCMKDWAKKIGIKYQTLRERIRRGWPHDLALTTPSSFTNSGIKINRIQAQNPIVKRDHWPTECARGHVLTPENSHHASSGKPYCKICARARYRMRAGWPEDLALSMGVVPHGHRPVNGKFPYKRNARSAGGSPDV